MGLKKLGSILFSKENLAVPENFEWRLSEVSAKKLVFEDVEFAFKQAEKQLDGTVNESGILLNRTMILITLILGLVTSLVGYIIGNIESTKFNINLVLVSVIAICFMLNQGFNLVHNLKGHKYATSGSEPALLLDEFYLIEIPNKDDRVVAMYLNELKSYQKRIYSNKLKNYERWKIFNHSLKMIASLPFILVVSYLAIKLITTMF